MTNNIFERNPGKTIFCFVLTIFIILDFSGKSILGKNKEGIPSPFYHHDLKRNVKVTVKWGQEHYPMITNSLGFRDKSKRKINLKNSHGKRRLVFMGDSFVEGVGLPYEKTFVGFLNDKLDTGKIEILNAGVCAYSPKLYYLKIKYLLDKGLKFDGLYTLIDISDIENEIFYEKFQPSHFRIMDCFLKKHSLVYGFLRSNIFNKSEIIRIISYKDFKKKDYYIDCTRDDIEFLKKRGQISCSNSVFEKRELKGLALAKENMKKLYDLCERNNIKMTIIVYPWPSQIVEKEILSKHRMVWQTFAKERNIDFIDCFPYFINDDSNPKTVVDKYFIKDDIHWNENGHKLVADSLFLKILSPKQL